MAARLFCQARCTPPNQEALKWHEAFTLGHARALTRLASWAGSSGRRHAFPALAATVKAAAGGAVGGIECDAINHRAAVAR
jgi:hypothetical protein